MDLLASEAVQYCSWAMNSFEYTSKEEATTMQELFSQCFQTTIPFLSFKNKWAFETIQALTTMMHYNHDTELSLFTTVLEPYIRDLCHHVATKQQLQQPQTKKNKNKMTGEMELEIDARINDKSQTSFQILDLLRD